MAQRTSDQTRLNLANALVEQAESFRAEGKPVIALVLHRSAEVVKTNRVGHSQVDDYLNGAKWFVDAVKEMKDGDNFTVWHHVGKDPRAFTAFGFERAGNTLRVVALGNGTFAL